MAPPPGEQNGGETTAADASRSLPTPFLTKTYLLVDDHSIDDVISWNEDGSTFIVWNPTDFAKDLLPKYFKHNNYSSFVRQLNTYGFRKVVPDRWEFSNECFRKGEKRLLCDIQRRKIATTPVAAAEAAAAVTVAVLPASAPLTGTPSNSNSGEEQVISSNSPPPPAATPMLLCREYTTCGETGGLIDENERLRKENTRLNRELSQMKNLYTNIHSLMSNFANNQQESSGSQAVRPLDLLPSKLFGEGSGVTVGGYCESMPEDEMNPRLFGVQIGAKRLREGEREGQQPLLRLQLGEAEVKCEPLDHRDGGNDVESSWLTERACS